VRVEVWAFAVQAGVMMEAREGLEEERAAPSGETVSWGGAREMALGGEQERGEEWAWVWRPPLRIP
jgi:hypothetical protein